MQDIKKIELITEIETDNKTVLFNHIQENEEEFEEVKLSIEELDSKLQNIQLTPGEKGDKGDKGDKGERGNDGLNGKDGVDGRDGLNGLDGRDGVDGKDGGKGEQGEKGDKPKHRWKGTQLQFEKPDGTWGQLIDLRGLQGQIGLSGGSLGASYPGVKLNNQLLTTGAREFNFSGGITASVVGTSVTVETEPIDLSGYVPYTGATNDLNLGINGIGGGAASFASLSLDSFYLNGNTLQTILANLVLDSTGYDIDSIASNFTWGASASADNMTFDNQYLTLKSGSSANGIYIQNDATTGDPILGFKLGSSILGYIGVRDSDSDAVYISGGSTFSSKNIRLTSTDTQFFKATSMNKASFAVAQSALATGATPTVAGANAWTTSNSGATNITDFTNGVTGQIITVIGADGGNTTVTDTASILLAGSVNFTLGDDDTLVLYYNGSRWLELSRSNN